MKAQFLFVIIPLLLSFQLRAETNAIEELDPYAPDISAQLKVMDINYEAATGISSYPTKSIDSKQAETCYQRTCKIFIDVNKKTQMAELFIDGVLTHEWKVSTGTPGHGTPNFDRHPDGRIYVKYSSSKYPGGNYNGLGNMPYVVFIKGGFAIHGTTKGNWPKLGKKASHGCIRLHPDHAKIFNGLVRQYGVKSTWVTVR